MIAELTQGLRSLVFPASCPGCGAAFTGPAGTPLCSPCSAGLRTLPAPWFFPRESSLDKSPLDAALSPFLYEGACRQMILALKYHARLSLVSFFALRMAEEVRRRLGENPADLVLPVPLHPVRERERSFNQAQRLARALAAHLGLPCRSDLIMRARATAPQTRLDRRERRRNLRGAFAPREASCLRGATVLLVDDVLTTGSTAEACARLLKRAGAARVIAVTAAQDR